MIEFKIKLQNIQAVKDFCNLAGKNEGDVLVSSDRYIVDGKSLLGLFSLDFSHEIKVQVFDTVTLNLSEFDKFKA